MPSGELNAGQLRFMANAIRPYGADGCADITTRAAIQLRGLPLEVGRGGLGGGGSGAAAAAGAKGCLQPLGGARACVPVCAPVS